MLRPRSSMLRVACIVLLASWGLPLAGSAISMCCSVADTYCFPDPAAFEKLAAQLACRSWRRNSSGFGAAAAINNKLYQQQPWMAFEPATVCDLALWLVLSLRGQAADLRRIISFVQSTDPPLCMVNPLLLIKGFPLMACVRSA